MNSINVIILSYGNTTEYNRAIFAIWSFFAWCRSNERVRLVIFTDSPDYFKNYLGELNCFYTHLTPDVLDSLLAGSSYIHRRKIAVIDLTFRQFPDGNLLFLDSDTFFVRNPEKALRMISDKTGLMHKREYSFEQGLQFYRSFGQEHYPQAFIDYIESHEMNIDHKKERFNRRDYGWNSGVLGLDSSFKKHLPTVFELTDRFYENSAWFISEQLAFSCVLQRTRNLVPAEHVVVHYWGKRQKKMVDALLEDFLKKNPVLTKDNINLVRSLTQQWRRSIETDILLEEASIALRHKQWKYGFKKGIQAILKSPIQRSVYQQLYADITFES